MAQEGEALPPSIWWSSLSATRFYHIRRRRCLILWPPLDSSGTEIYHSSQSIWNLCTGVVKS